MERSIGENNNHLGCWVQHTMYVVGYSKYVSVACTNVMV